MNILQFIYILLMNIKLFPIFFLSTTKIATVILVHVFLSTYTREFTWITYEELLYYQAHGLY